jgi:hypothetical protein
MEDVKYSNNLTIQFRLKLEQCKFYTLNIQNFYPAMTSKNLIP